MTVDLIILGEMTADALCRSLFSDFLGIFGHDTEGTCLPAEPAFPCGDDNNNTTTTTLADLDWGFSRPAAVRGPGSADLDWGLFPAGGGPGSGVGGFGLGVFRAGGDSHRFPLTPIDSHRFP